VGQSVGVAAGCDRPPSCGALPHAAGSAAAPPGCSPFPGPSRSHRRVGDLAEHPAHQSAVGAFLGLPPFGHLYPKCIAHPIGRQRSHLGMGGVNLIWRRAKPLARRLTSDQFAHTPTLSNAHVSHDTRMRTHTHPGDENGSGDPRPRHSKMSEPDARRLRRARNDRGERRADPGRAVDPQMATDRFDAVDQSDQT